MLFLPSPLGRDLLGFERIRTSQDLASHEARCAHHPARLASGMTENDIYWCFLFFFPLSVWQDFNQPGGLRYQFDWTFTTIVRWEIQEEAHGRWGSASNHNDTNILRSNYQHHNKSNQKKTKNTTRQDKQRYGRTEFAIGLRKMANGGCFLSWCFSDSRSRRHQAQLMYPFQMVRHTPSWTCMNTVLLQILTYTFWATACSINLSCRSTILG